MTSPLVSLTVYLFIHLWSIFLYFQVFMQCTSYVVSLSHCFEYLIFFFPAFMPSVVIENANFLSLHENYYLWLVSIYSSSFLSEASPILIKFRDMPVLAQIIGYIYIALFFGIASTLTVLISMNCDRGRVWCTHGWHRWPPHQTTNMGHSTLRCLTWNCWIQLSY